MSNLLMISHKTFFIEDLTRQIELYAPEFSTAFADETPDIIIIDEQPNKVSELSKKYPHTPIFALLKNSDEKPQNKPLIKYFNKPLLLVDIINELKAAVNVATFSDAGILHFNCFELRPLSKEICNMTLNETVKLTEKEVSIIQYLFKSGQHIVSKNELLQEVWGYNPDVTTHTIETHIYRLRQKVEHNGKDAPFIITEDGGYLLIK